MRYIVQVFTGNYDAPSHTAREIIEKLEFVTAQVTVEKVIVGWATDRQLYREIGAYLHSKGIQMLLWLPVFSETGDFVPMEWAVDVWGRPIQPPTVQAGESFTFCCPSSPHNLTAVKAVYERYFADGGFDGVFLDRIRTHSFVGGVEGVLSCGCTHCREAYAARGVALRDVAASYEQLGDRFFDVTEELAFAQPLTQRFFEAKAAIVTAAVRELCRYFHEKEMCVGLDLYAPLISPFVGQSYPLLAAQADFIKPMLYRRTDAPAGIAYEYELISRFAPTAQGYPPFAWDAAFLRDELDALKALPCDVYAGIEINRSGIAPTDEAYVCESLRVVRDSGVAGAVLSWSIMDAPAEHIRAAGTL